jgi:hypothetical protein
MSQGSAQRVVDADTVTNAAVCGGMDSAIRWCSPAAGWTRRKPTLRMVRDDPDDYMK